EQETDPDRRLRIGLVGLPGPMARGAGMTNGRLQRTRVGVLGTGEVGRRLAAGFNSRGHEVVIGSRDPQKPDLREWLSDDGAGVQAAAFTEAAEHGELLVLAVLGDAAQDVIAQVDPKNFGGKVVIDAMN